MKRNSQARNSEATDERAVVYRASNVKSAIKTFNLKLAKECV